MSMFLPKLQPTQLLDHPTIVDALDIWSEEWRTPQMFEILGGPGVYVFYIADVGTILYVGSSGSRSYERSAAGLMSRLRKYYMEWTRSTGRITKSVSAIKLDRSMGIRVLVKCWRTETAADALKYEYDAIATLKPKYNVHASREILTLEQKKELAKQRWRIRRAKRTARAAEMYAAQDPSTPKLCGSCKKTKAISEFGRDCNRHDGRQPSCKECNREAGRRYYHKRKNEHTESATTGGERCRPLPTQIGRPRESSGQRSSTRRKAG